MKHSSSSILTILFAGGIVQTFYYSTVAIYLNGLNYSAFAISSCIAATALPHVFFGPRLGRMVDLSQSKKKLFLSLHYGMAISLFFLTFAEQLNFQWIAGIAMLLFATLLSPYQSLFTHYLLPSLSEDEDHIYSRWEFIYALSIFVGGLLSFFLLMKFSAKNLIQTTAISYAICGTIIYYLWKPKLIPVENVERPEGHNSLKHVVCRFVSDRGLLLAILGMWAFAFSIDALANNAQVLALKSFTLSSSWIALLGVSFSIFNIIGSKIYQLLPISWKEDRLKFQSVLAISLLLPLLICGIAYALNYTVILLVAVISFGILEPFWHINNTVLLRSKLPKNEYGELFGWIRSPRAIVTYIGTSLVGAAQDHSRLDYICYLFFAVIAALVVLQMKFRSKRIESLKN